MAIRETVGRNASACLRALRRGRRPVLLGSFARRRPLGTQWGYDRGTPVDRWYIERFLREHRADIRGRVLEVKDSGYTERFGADVTERGVLDVDPANPAAAYVADLTTCEGIPPGSFDCFVLTQTLQFVLDVPAALRSVHRVLRPGGVLLATVPVASRVAPPPLTDYWRFTPLAVERLAADAFGPGVDVRGRGNVLAQVAFLQGLAAEELGEDDLAFDDPDYPLVVCVRARRADG